MIAFRSLQGEDMEHSILYLWCALLPALAQLWYRFSIYFSYFPFRLLILVSAYESAEVKERVVDAFLSASECCLDAGFAQLLLAFMGTRRWSTQVRKSFLLSNYFLQVLKTWAHSISISVFDLECKNGGFRNACNGGRLSQNEK